MNQAARTTYDRQFFDRQVDGSLRSARIIAPLILELTACRSVVDLGCGRGSWLRAFREQGVADVLGLDGPYLDPAELLIEPGEFEAGDLTRPLHLGRRFDLAVCVEVAEHLPTGSSRTLVRSLAEAAPMVLFSAAIPGQGGTHHVNEQWPEFWDRHFAEAGLARLDVIRPRIWRDRSVEWWYRQNLFLYADRAACAGLAEPGPDPAAGPEMEIISADLLGRFKTIRGLSGELARATVRGIKNRLRRG